MKTPDPPSVDPGESGLLVDEICPRVSRDIQAWVLFEKAEGNQYVVGSLSLDRYISVPANRLAATMALIHLFDGQHSLQSLKEYTRDQLNLDADVERFY